MFNDLSLIGIMITAYFGLVAGSFASALIYRIPRNVPWTMERKSEGSLSASRSACPSCKAPLKIWDLIPLFSWLALRGKCRYCKASISAIYPLAEMTSLLAFIAVYLVFGLTWPSVFIFIMIPFLVALLYIDLEHFILPDELVILCGLSGLAHLFTQGFLHHISWNEIVWEHLLGGALLYALLAYGVGWLVSKLLKKDALGFGDVKFFGVAGLWLGLSLFSDFLIFSGITGVLFALMWKWIKKEDVFPFGPSIIISFFILLFFESSLLI